MSKDLGEIEVVWELVYFLGVVFVCGGIGLLVRGCGCMLHCHL